MLEMAAFQGQIRAVRALPRADRMTRAKALADANLRPPLTAVTAIALLLLLKDSADSADDWDWISSAIAKLPPEIGRKVLEIVPRERERRSDQLVVAVELGHVYLAGRAAAVVGVAGHPCDA